VRVSPREHALSDALGRLIYICVRYAEDLPAATLKLGVTTCVALAVMRLALMLGAVDLDVQLEIHQREVQLER